MTKVCRLARFGLTTGDASRLAAFYQRALGFRPIAAEYVAGAAFETMMGVEGGARRVTPVSN